MNKYLTSLILFLTVCIFSPIVRSEEFKLEARQLGLIEHSLLSQAIDNDIQIKRLDKELSRAGFVRDVGGIVATSNMVGVRVINLSSKDRSVRFITNGLQLGSDAINITTFAYRMLKGKKIKEEMDKRINIINKDLLKAFSRLEASQDDIEAKNKLISYVGEKSTNDYLRWLALEGQKVEKPAN